MQRRLHQSLRFAVESRCSFIQNQDRSVLQNCAGNGDALALASGKPYAALSNYLVVARGQRLDEVVRQAARPAASTSFSGT